MSINAEVQKTGAENALATIRKFSRRVQGAGLIRTVRKGRYFARDASKIVKKKRALKLIKRRTEFKQLVKEGKVAEPAPRRGGGQGGSYSDRPASGPRPAESTPVIR
jgi:ribosomal protein S21